MLLILVVDRDYWQARLAGELPVLVQDRPGSLEPPPDGREWPGLAPEAPAYLIHTSGSTACPGGPGTCTIGQLLGLVDTPVAMVVRSPSFSAARLGQDLTLDYS
ncbi:hypothetical protein [Azovibrio restrictus]|uniref:hypothetical protein n=1 Tax=Azovibrio restrictus TaxID=146938 RepID=UPI0026EEAD55|nr:hypothetical protein [Azovibrio restrictus]MDD3481824.1 hypothetical protein [Azovibrio restrictus]